MKLLKEVDYGEYFLEVASKKQKTLAGGFIYLLSHLTWLYCEQMWLHKHDEEHPLYADLYRVTFSRLILGELLILWQQCTFSLL